MKMKVDHKQSTDAIFHQQKLPRCEKITMIHLNYYITIVDANLACLSNPINL